MFRFGTPHHVKLPRTSNTRSAKARVRRVGHHTSSRTVNAPVRW